jgi:hypothetical protein
LHSEREEIHSEYEKNGTIERMAFEHLHTPSASPDAEPPVPENPVVPNPDAAGTERIEKAGADLDPLAESVRQVPLDTDEAQSEGNAPDVTPEEFDAYAQARYDTMIAGIQNKIAGSQNTVARAKETSRKGWLETPGGTWAERIAYSLIPNGFMLQKVTNDVVNNTYGTIEEEEKAVTALENLKGKLEHSWKTLSAIEDPFTRASAQMDFIRDTNAMLGIDEEGNVLVGDDGKPLGEIYKAQPDFTRLEADMKRVDIALDAAEYTLRTVEMAKDVAASYAGPPGIAVSMAPRYIIGLATGSMTLEQACWQLPEDVALAYIGGKASGSVMKLLGPRVKKILAKAAVPGAKLTGDTMRALFMEIVDAFSDSAVQGLFIEAREKVSGQESQAPDFMQRAYSNFVGGMMGRGMAKGLQVGGKISGKIQRGRDSGTEVSASKNEPSTPRRIDAAESVPPAPKSKVLTPEEEMLKRTVMGLDDSVEGLTKRALYAEEVLQRPLTDEQKQAVIDAHLAGTPVIAADSTTTYGMGALRTKMQRLQRAGFSLEESDRLLRMGVTGSNAVRQAPPAPKRGEALRTELASTTNGARVKVYKRYIHRRHNNSSRRIYAPVSS